MSRVTLSDPSPKRNVSVIEISRWHNFLWRAQPANTATLPPFAQAGVIPHVAFWASAFPRPFIAFCCRLKEGDTGVGPRLTLNLHVKQSVFCMAGACLPQSMDVNLTPMPRLLAALDHPVSWALDKSPVCSIATHR